MKRTLILLLSLVVAASGARANDGSITWGVAPRLTQSHASISMQSEIVRLVVGKEVTRVDCRFVFVNHGPACTVRMGFPDHSDDDEMQASAQFQSFRSFVDGREVLTRSVLGPRDEDNFRVQWRVKTVRFGARAPLRVEYATFTPSIRAAPHANM